KLTTRIDENATALSVVDTIKFNEGASEILRFTLSGNGSENFDVDNNGIITVAPDAILDYETQHEISLSVIASNIIGDSRPKNVVVRLNNIPDVVPTLSDVNISINKETATEITIVNILKNAGDTKISSFTLSPNSEFGVDLNGNIYLKTSLLNQNSTSFTLQASATNSFGKSEIANVNISLIVIPVINDFIGVVYDNTQATTKIGKLNIVNGNAIETITLSGEGSSDFSVDLSGNISVANGITIKASRQDYYSFGVTVNGIYDATITLNVLNRIIGSVDTPSGAYGVTLSADGTKAFVADYHSGLQIIDISNPTAPVIIGSVDTPGRAYKVTISTDGTKAFVADANSGLQIIDISDPTAPVIIGSVDTPGWAFEITISTDGTKAFVADADSGLQIIDISDPTAPVTIGSVDTPGYANGVTLSTDGTKAFVADGSSGLQIIDISDPTAPVIIGSVDTPGNAQGVTLSTDGTKAFVVDFPSGLQIIDISDPTASVIIGSVDTPGWALAVTLLTDETKAFVADYASGLQIIDITGLEVPQKVPGISGFSTIIEGDSAIESIVGEIKVYYSGESGISSFRLDGDRADYFSIDINGVVRLEKELEYFVGNVYDLKAIATNEIGEKEVNVNIHIHSLPEVQNFTASVKSMSVEGTYVGKLDIFLGDNNTITDIYLSGEGSEKFTVNTLGEIQVATQAELHHFVKADYNLTLNATNRYGNSNSNVTISVSGIMSSVDTPSHTRTVTLSTDGTKAFVADEGSGLQIIDISDPTAPVIIGSVDTPGRAYGVTLSADGTKAFVADANSGLQIIDISDPTASVIIGSVDTPGNAWGVTLSTDGTKAFVADKGSGLQIIDITGL
ncbi:MAG: hypothetical protein L3I99_02630, partial [Sulfurimonas sp.]|nr:hypothetical protein [Sulfurimonas sp.]